MIFGEGDNVGDEAFMMRQAGSSTFHGVRTAVTAPSPECATRYSHSMDRDERTNKAPATLRP